MRLIGGWGLQRLPVNEWRPHGRPRTLREADTRALLASACERACGPDAGPALIAFTVPQVAQRIRDERRDAAVRGLSRSEGGSGGRRHV